MRWDGKEKNNGWRVRFALVPLKIGDTWIWWERYIAKDMSIYTAVDFYEGCANRAGYPCDCFRHPEITPQP